MVIGMAPAPTVRIELTPPDIQPGARPASCMGVDHVGLEPTSMESNPSEGAPTASPCCDPSELAVGVEPTCSSLRERCTCLCATPALVRVVGVEPTIPPPRTECDKPGFATHGSERRDSNPRSLGPQPSAIPNFATFRWMQAVSSRHWIARDWLLVCITFAPDPNPTLGCTRRRSGTRTHDLCSVKAAL